MGVIKKNKGGRPRKEPKRTISYRVAVIVAEQVKEKARPIVKKIEKKLLDKIKASKG